MKALLLVAAIWLSVLAPGAEARVRLLDEEGRVSPRDRQMTDALVPSPDVTLTVVDEPQRIVDRCGVPRACTARGETVVWIRRSARRVEFRHEIGHQFDYAMTDRMWRRFLALTGRKGTPWEAKPNGPSEQFAEAWRLCAYDPRRPARAEYMYDYRPSLRTHRRICRTIRREAVRQGWNT